jgi:hypothetical protein
LARDKSMESYEEAAKRSPEPGIGRIDRLVPFAFSFNSAPWRGKARKTHRIGEINKQLH